MESSKIILFFLALLFSKMEISAGQNMTDEMLLVDKLMTNYKTGIRPYTNMSEATVVTASYIFYKIVEVNIQEGMFSGPLSISLQWHDPRMTWNPSDYGNLTQIMLKKTEVWWPPIFLGSIVDSLETYGIDDDRVIYDYNGTASLLASDLAKVSCDYNEKKYPFDQHVCFMYLFLLGYTSQEVRFQVGVSSVLSAGYFEHPEWNVVSSETNIRTVAGFQSVVASITIRRRELHFFLVRFLPIVALALLNALVFKIPIESGDRIGYSITCLLSLVVFLSDINNALPAGSLNISYTSTLLTCMVLGSALACAFVLFTTSLYHKPEDRPVPKTLQVLARFLSKLCCCRRRSGSDKKLPRTTVQVYPVGECDQVPPQKEDNTEVEWTWQDVVKVFDEFFFYLCSFCVLFFLFLILMLTAT